MYCNIGVICYDDDLMFRNGKGVLVPPATKVSECLDEIWLF